MSISHQGEDYGIPQVVQAITQSIRSFLSMQDLSARRKIRKCAQSCKELLDFSPFHNFEDFHSFVLAIGYKNQSQKSVLEKACLEAWFNSKKFFENSVILADSLLPEETSKQEKFLHGPLISKRKNLPSKGDRFRHH